MANITITREAMEILTLPQRDKLFILAQNMPVVAHKGGLDLPDGYIEFRQGDDKYSIKGGIAPDGRSST